MVKDASKPFLLFVGASGAVANKVLPELSKHFTIVGISHSRTELAPYCVEHIVGNLLTSHEKIFKQAFALHEYTAVIWNAVVYFPSYLRNSNRETLHTEFDLSVALPLVCAQFYLKQPGMHKKHFIGVSSKAAFGDKAPRASYSIIKRAQMELFTTLAPECPEICFSVIAPGRVRNITDTRLLQSFMNALGADESGHVYIVDEDSPEF